MSSMVRTKSSPNNLVHFLVCNIELYCYFALLAPSLFALLFPIVKKMLAAKTIGKVQLYDGNASKWKKALLSIISPSSLPMKYGGILPDRLQKVFQPCCI